MAGTYSDPHSRRTLFYFTLLGATVTVDASAAGSKPNIIWVMADDMGWGEPGLYPSTSQHGRITTPNLDKFGE